MRADHLQRLLGSLPSYNSPRLKGSLKVNRRCRRSPRFRLTWCQQLHKASLTEERKGSRFRAANLVGQRLRRGLEQT